MIARPRANGSAQGIIASKEDPAISKDTGTPINEQIRAREVRTITEDGDQLGVLPLREALRVAREKGLDLVMVSPTAVPPVCRIMDYGRHKYETDKRLREAKKKQHVVEIKELTISYKIGQHDYDTKLRALERFIKDGNKVKMTVRMRGREEQHSGLAVALLRRFADDVGEIAVMEREPKPEGRNVIMILNPKKEK